MKGCPLAGSPRAIGLDGEAVQCVVVKPLEDRIRCDGLADRLGTWEFQQLVRQGHAECQHANASQHPCATERSLPVKFGGGPNEECDRDDELEAAPGVLGSVEAERQEKVFRGQCRHWLTQEHFGAGTMPDSRTLKREMKGGWGEAGVHFDRHGILPNKWEVVLAAN